MRYVFIECKLFMRLREYCFGGDDNFRAFQEYLNDNPRAGTVIPGLGGARKIRWRREGKGKSAGLRVIYYHYADYQTIHLVVPYTKSMKSDLTPDDKREICVLAEEFQLWLSERQKRVE